MRLPIDAATWAAYLTDSTETSLTPTEILPQQEMSKSGTPSELLPQDIDKPLLLVVEDNPDLRAYMRTILEGEYRILEAIDGLDGLEQAYEHIPNLAVCDVMMPRLDGFGFCKKLKTDARTSHIPVVMLTAKATLADRLEGLELGADDYLTKPFVRQELQTRLRNLLRQREVLRQKYSHQLAGKIAGAPWVPADGLHLVEDEFLRLAIATVTQHMPDSSFNVEEFSALMRLSRTQLHRKLKALTNQSSTEFIRHIRIRHAAELLKKQRATVSEVAYQVGFESVSYFSKSFREQMGASPSNWIATQNS